MAEWASSSVAVRRSWGWWRCRWRGGFIRAGARGKHRPEGAARSNYLQGSPLGEGLHRQRDMHPSFFWHCWRQQAILDLHVVYVSKKKAQRYSPGVPHANADTGGSSPGASYRALPEWLPGASPAPACMSGWLPQPSRGLGRFGCIKCATTEPNTKAPYQKAPIIGTHLKPIARTHNSNNPARRRYVITHTHATQPSAANPWT